ncbi:MAG: UPF0182 family protein [Thermoplasmatota archaeon]
MVAQGNWEIVLRFLNGQSFGIADPIFHREIGFYVFDLPFYRDISVLGIGGRFRFDDHQVRYLFVNRSFDYPCP